MSKYIKQKTEKVKQPKPKLKVLVQVGEESFYVNEFDAFQMLSDLTARVTNIEYQLKGIIDAMNAATQGAATNVPPVTNSKPQKVDIKLPKLNEVKKGGLNDGKSFYGYGSDKPNIVE